MNSNLATTTWLQAIIRFTIGSDISASQHNVHFTAHKSLHQINSVLQTLGQCTTETFFLFGWPPHLMPLDTWHKFWFSEVHLLYYAWESMTLPHLSRVLSEYIYCIASRKRCWFNRLNFCLSNSNFRSRFLLRLSSWGMAPCIHSSYNLTNNELSLFSSSSFNILFSSDKWLSSFTMVVAFTGSTLIGIHIGSASSSSHNTQLKVARSAGH